MVAEFWTFQGHVVSAFAVPKAIKSRPLSPRNPLQPLFLSSARISASTQTSCEVNLLPRGSPTLLGAPSYGESDEENL